jgi:translation initiation factor 5B
MPPKVGKPQPKATGAIALLKARVEAQRKAEEEQKRLEEEERKKEEEEIRLAEEERIREEKEKEERKEQDKNKRQENDKNKKRQSHLEALYQMKKSGSIVPTTPELEKYIEEREKELEQRQRQNKEQNKEQNKNKENSDVVKDAEEKNKSQNTKDKEDNEDKDINNEFRAPICCVLGHVDTGKTSLLDKIRRTRVQEGEVGGITQQIGATYFPHSFLKTMMQELLDKNNSKLCVPGLLMIDTPGHESFSNLRNRGSSICDVAILVIDIMHGLENQTRESIKMLEKKNCKFIIALNKIDKIYGWETKENATIQNSLAKQKAFCMTEYETRLAQIQLQLSEEGINSEIYYNNKNPNEYISIVPVSARTGEGISDLIYHQIQLTQELMNDKIMYKENLECTVLEVKHSQGLGVTIDVILSNGTLSIGDKIVLGGINKPIVTKIRSLLTPQLMKELRVKSEYQDHKSIKAAQCFKISADGLDEAIPGTQLYVVKSDNDLDKYIKESENEVTCFTNKISKDKVGVAVQSSTIGSLEALLTFLEEMGVPVGYIGLGPIRKKNLTHSLLMKKKNPKFACILAFDVELDNESKTYAEKEGIQIFSADIIYHLFDKFTKHLKEYENVQKEKNKLLAVFPVVLKVLCCFNAKDPLVIGCRVERGQIRNGTPLCVRTNNGIKIGRVSGMQINNKDVMIAKKGMELAIKLDGKTKIIERGKNGEEIEREQLITYGRQIDDNTILTSSISRKSIDALKESFRDDMEKDDWELIIELKKEQGVI